MDSLQAWQAERIRDALFPSINYMGRLQMRMEETSFSPTDPLLKLVKKSFDAMHALYNEMNYQSCKSGAGREPKEE